jgi:hypothetical protein
MYRKTLLVLVAALTAALWVVTAPLALASGSGQPTPRLVVQITVDQLRADLVERVMDRLGPGGFRLLYERGAVHATAHHRHANTETIVGHTTLATGADPSVHGMVGNIWLDRETGLLAYNIEDDRYPLLTAGAGGLHGPEDQGSAPRPPNRDRRCGADLVAATADQGPIGGSRSASDRNMHCRRCAHAP